MVGYRCCSFWFNCLYSGGLNVIVILFVFLFVFVNEEFIFKMNVMLFLKCVFLIFIFWFCLRLGVVGCFEVN